MLDFRRAYAERERAERAVRGGVRIAAHNRHAGLRETEHGRERVHDALVRVAERVQAHAEFAAVLLERRQLRGARLVRVRLVYVDRGRVVVFGGDELVEVPRCATGQAEPLKRLRTGHFVHQHEVDIQQVGSAVAALAHQMIGPNLFGQCHSHKPVPPSVVACAGRALPCFSRAARLPHASLSVQTKGWRIAGRVLCQNARCEGFFKDVADCFRTVKHLIFRGI